MGRKKTNTRAITAPGEGEEIIKTSTYHKKAFSLPLPSSLPDRPFPFPLSLFPSQGVPLSFSSLPFFHPQQTPSSLPRSFLSSLSLSLLLLSLLTVKFQQIQVHLVPIAATILFTKCDITLTVGDSHLKMFEHLRVRGDSSHGCQDVPGLVERLVLLVISRVLLTTETGVGER